MQSFRNKAMGALAVGFFLRVANAAPVIVFEGPIDKGHQEVSADFGVNRKLGRAWIEVKVTTDSFNESPPLQVWTLMLVEALFYNSANNQGFNGTWSGPIVWLEAPTF